MTRENKLALVVGFGLILFVGILISDHFSIVRTQQAADLTRTALVDPLASTISQSNLIDLSPQPPSVVATPAVTPATIVSGEREVADQVRPEHRTIIDPNGYQQQPMRVVQQPGSNVAINGAEQAPSQIPAGFNAVTPEPEAQQVRVVYHDVRSGETLFAICRQHYGNTSLSSALAKYNKIDDPASLRAGRRLVIPRAEELGGRSPTPPSPSALASATSSASPNATSSSLPPVKPVGNLPIQVVRTMQMNSAPQQQPSAASAKPKPAAAAAKTYTVKPGDSLAQIAQRFYGSKGQWRKLHEMNRDVIEDPHALKVGTVLRVL